MKPRTIIIIILVAIIMFTLYRKDKVGTALLSLSTEYVNWYASLNNQKREAVTGFREKRANITPPEGTEEILEELKDLGFDITVRERE